MVSVQLLGMRTGNEVQSKHCMTALKNAESTFGGICGSVSWWLHMKGVEGGDISKYENIGS
jgi:hypothetical protein